MAMGSSRLAGAAYDIASGDSRQPLRRNDPAFMAVSGHAQPVYFLERYALLVDPWVSVGGLVPSIGSGGGKVGGWASYGRIRFFLDRKPVKIKQLTQAVCRVKIGALRS